MAHRDDRSGDVRRTSLLVARLVLALLGASIGVTIVVLAMAFGSCYFFGGSCPAAPEPWWENDTFGMLALGLSLATTLPLLAWRPNRFGLALAASAVVASLPIAWFIAEGLRTGSL